MSLATSKPTQPSPSTCASAQAWLVACCGDAVGHEIAADIARGKAEQAGRRDEDLGVILTDVRGCAPSPGSPAPCDVTRRHRWSAGLGRRWRRRRPPRQDRVRADERHQLVQARDIVALADRGRKRPRRLVRQRQRGLAQEQPQRRKAAVQARHACLVVGLDLAGRLECRSACGSPSTLISRVSLLEMVGKAHLLARALDRQRPRADLLRGAAAGTSRSRCSA